MPRARQDSAKSIRRVLCSKEWKEHNIMSGTSEINSFNHFLSSDLINNNFSEISINKAKSLSGNGNNSTPTFVTHFEIMGKKVKHVYIIGVAIVIILLCLWIIHKIREWRQTNIRKYHAYSSLIPGRVVSGVKKEHNRYNNKLRDDIPVDILQQVISPHYRKSSLLSTENNKSSSPSSLMEEKDTCDDLLSGIHLCKMEEEDILGPCPDEKRILPIIERDAASTQITSENKSNMISRRWLIFSSCLQNKSVSKIIASRHLNRKRIMEYIKSVRSSPPINPLQEWNGTFHLEDKKSKSTTINNLNINLKKKAIFEHLSSDFFKVSGLINMKTRNNSEIISQFGQTSSNFLFNLMGESMFQSRTTKDSQEDTQYFEINLSPSFVYQDWDSEMGNVVRSFHQIEVIKCIKSLGLSVARVYKMTLNNNKGNSNPNDKRDFVQKSKRVASNNMTSLINVDIVNLNILMSTTIQTYLHKDIENLRDSSLKRKYDCKSWWK